MLIALFAMLVGPACACDAAIQDPAPWHATMQERDGRWPANEGGAADPADLRVSAWMLLALLGDGNTVREGHLREPVRKTLRWLIARQDAHGRFGLHTSPDWLLDHAITTCAVAEALAGDRREEAEAPTLAAVAALQRELTRQRPVPGVEVRLWSLLAANALRAHAGEPPDPARAAAADALRAAIDALPALPEPADADPVRQRCARVLFDALVHDRPVQQWPECWPRDPTSDPLATFYAIVSGWQSGGRIWKDVSTRYGRPVSKLKLPLGPSDVDDGFEREHGCTGATALHLLQMTLYYRYCRLTLTR